MAPPHTSAILTVLHALEDNELNLEDLLITILTDPAYKDHTVTVSVTKAAINSICNKGCY